MMGIPDEDDEQIFDWTNVILGVGDPEFGGDVRRAASTAALEMYDYAQELGEDRLANPTRRPHVGADARRGRRRAADAQEFGSFFILLVVAGNETTRNAISRGMKALTDHPDQRRAGGTTSTA